MRCPGCRRLARSWSIAGGFRTSTRRASTTPSCSGLQCRARSVVADRPVAPARARAAGGGPRPLVRRAGPRDPAVSVSRGPRARVAPPMARTRSRSPRAFTAGVNAYVELIERSAVRLPLEFQALGYAAGDAGQPEDVVRIRSHGLISQPEQQVDRALVAAGVRPRGRGAAQAAEPRVATYVVPEGWTSTSSPMTCWLSTGWRSRRCDFTERDGRGARRGTRARRGLEQLGRSPARRRRPAARSWPTTRTAPIRRAVAALPRASEAPGMNVIGAGEPALPGISIGHNGTIAFGLTIFAIDQEDLYVYETRPGSPDEYRYRDGWEPMTVSRSTSRSRTRRAGRRVTLRFTRHGPVIARGRAKAARPSRCARCGSSRASPRTSASISYMRASNWPEFRRGAAPLGRARREPGLCGQCRATSAGSRAVSRRSAATGTGCCPCPATAATNGTASSTPTRCRSSAIRSAAGWRRPTQMNLPRGYPYQSPQARLRVGGALPVAAHPGGTARASAMRPWPTRGVSRSTTVRFRLRGSSRCSPTSSRATAAPRARSGCCAAGTVELGCTPRRRVVRGLDRDRAPDRGAPAPRLAHRRPSMPTCSRRSDRDHRLASSDPTSGSGAIRGAPAIARC